MDGKRSDLEALNPTSRHWHPDASWADPLIILLALAFIILGLGGRPKPKGPGGAGIPARIQELLHGARDLVPTLPMKTVPANPGGEWDRAVMAILDAEKNLKSPVVPEAPEGPAGKAFMDAWRAAYMGEGPSADTKSGSAPDSAWGARGGRRGSEAPGRSPSLEKDTELEVLRKPLGDGLAFKLLKARLAELRGEDASIIRAEARAWTLWRLFLLGACGLLAFIFGLTGLIGFSLVFVIKTRHPAPLPSFGMSFRAGLLVFFGWLLALRLSGMVAFLLMRLGLPTLLLLPFATLFHATIGVLLLLRAEGISFRTLWEKLTPGPKGRALGWGLIFLGIALCSVFAVSLMASPLTRNLQPPQQDLRQMISGFTGFPATLLLFSTIALLAPIFEELFFRGFLLPWLGQGLQPRLGEKTAWIWATLISGTLFGLIHLQPAGLPTLASLGVVLGWAFLRTRNLWTAILVHACWNSGAFILMRALG